MVRHAAPTRDAAACAEIYGFYVRDTAASFEEVAPSEQEMAARIARLGATHAWLVAEVDGRVAGYAYACPHRERASYRWAADVSVYVDPANHRRGVGRALYAALLEALREQDFQVAVAGITLPNDASVRLHESLGFELIGVYRGIGWKLGAWHDVGWWQRRLVPPGDEAPAEPLSARRRRSTPAGETPPPAT